MDSTGFGPIEPSGKLQVLEPKDFPYLHTGKSLVFTIARNGMIWGKRLDGQSSNGDVELEVFWPRTDGCLVRMMHDSKLGPIPIDILAEARVKRTFSHEQERKTEIILSQKEIIQYELGTLMVVPGLRVQDDGFHAYPSYRRMTQKPELKFTGNPPCNIKVVDCSWGKAESPLGKTEYQALRYEDSRIEFSFNSGHFYYVRALSGAFDISSWQPFIGLHRCKSELRIMYGEYDFFKYFEVDDAILLLEKRDDTNSLFWTLGIAQNKYVRKITRLASNNPDLFAPIFPKMPRRVGGGVTDTV